MKRINGFLAASLLFLNAAVPAGAVLPGTLANATRYDITFKLVELCSDAACSEVFILGDTEKTLDIASASAGSEVGQFIDITGIPLHKTWTHVRMTLAPSFVITATGVDQNANACKTDSANAASGHAALGVAQAAGAADGQIIFVPNVNAFGAGTPSAADYAGFNLTKADGSDVVITFPLSSPYTCKGVMPRVAVKFDTQGTLKFFDAGGGGTCRVYPMPPTVIITVSN